MIYNVGSINIDLVYHLNSLPRAGETLSAHKVEQFLGGKGANQSVAVHRAGGDVIHIGAVGEDGDWALNEISNLGLSKTHITQLNGSTGHAVVMVDSHAENQIIIHSGTNASLKIEHVTRALKGENNPWLLMQNETNLSEELTTLNAKLAYSAAPFNAEKVKKLLPHLTLLALNEGEADALETSLKKDPRTLNLPYLIITKGERGAELWMKHHKIEQAAFPTNPIDTTGAGDTFLGSFIARLDKGDSPERAMRYASAASALPSRPKRSSPCYSCL